MKLCEDCKKVEVSGKRIACHGCIAERKRLRSAANSKVRSEARLCRCGCGGSVPPHKKYFEGHYEAIRKKQVALNNKKRPTVSEKAERVTKKYNPNRIVMTSAQVDASCRKAEQELAKRREGLNMAMLVARKLQGAYAITAEQIGGLT